MKVVFDQLVQSLADSGLMTAEHVQALVDTLPDDKKPQSGEDLAKILYCQGKLTKFQDQAVYQGNQDSSLATMSFWTRLARVAWAKFS